jgi:hypothetical protein
MDPEEALPRVDDDDRELFALKEIGETVNPV